MEDTAQGFAFLNLFQKRFDTILMNPPFGEAPSSLTEQLIENFLRGIKMFYVLLLKTQSIIYRVMVS